jgi:hypothetical protein
LKSAWAVLHTVKRHGGKVEGGSHYRAARPAALAAALAQGLVVLPARPAPARFCRVIAFMEVVGQSVGA